jgi:hypothetical protein
VALVLALVVVVVVVVVETLAAGLLPVLSGDSDGVYTVTEDSLSLDDLLLDSLGSLKRSLAQDIGTQLQQKE